VRTLHPGDVALGSRGEVFETLLGSCVSVILTDPRRTVGAMSHIVHAGQPQAGEGDNTAHAEVAFERMFALLQGVGISPGLCEAYVYGGGNMFPALVRGRHVGQSNADTVLRTLRHTGIRVLVNDLGGQAYRRLRWTVGPDQPLVTAVPV
jgi:chemotaxis protein CheD